MQIGSFGADPPYAQMDAISTPSRSPAPKESTATKLDSQEPADSVSLGEGDESEAREAEPARSSASELNSLLESLKHSCPLATDDFKIKTPTVTASTRD